MLPSASANSSPSKKFNRAIVAVCVTAFETDKIASRTSAGYGTVAVATTRETLVNIHYGDVDAIHATSR